MPGVFGQQATTTSVLSDSQGCFARQVQLICVSFLGRSGPLYQYFSSRIPGCLAGGNS